MRRWLVALLLLLLAVVAVAGAEVPPPASDPLPAGGDLSRTLTLLEQVDPQALPADQQHALYLALADALLDAGQQSRALTFLVRVVQIPAPDLPARTDDQIRPRLEKIDTPVLLAALQEGSLLARLLQGELLRRGESLPATLGRERAIGVLLPLSGRHAPFGQAVQQGLELARTAMGGQSAVPFVYRDTAGDGASLLALVDELAGRQEVVAIVGPLLSSDAAAAAARAGQAQIPLLLLAQREGTTGDYVFRNALTLSAQVRALADFAGSEQLQRLAILHPATRYGEFCADQFQSEIERRNGRIVARQSYAAGAVDLRQQLQSLAADARRNGGLPDALFLPDDARQVAQIIPQLGFSRLDLLQLLGTNAWNDPELGRMAGPLSEGAVFVDGFFAGSSWPEVSDFVSRFQTAYGATPNILNAQGYDAGRIVLTLLARAGNSDREGFRRALGALRDFPGATGRTSFNADGEAEKSLFLLQVQDSTVVQIN